MKRISAARRLERAMDAIESATVDLFHFVETYNANAQNAQGHHRAKRRELLELARRYGTAVRRLARVAA